MAWVLTINGKHVHTKLTATQKAEQHARHTALVKGLKLARSAFTQEAEELMGKHRWSLKWTKTQLFLTTCLLTNFIVQNKQELLDAYNWLMVSQKQAYNNAVMTVHATKVPAAHSNAKSVSQVMSSAFSKMDQQVSLCVETGLEGFYVAVHGAVEDLSEPKVFFMEKAEKFVHNVLGIKLHHLALHLESWVISGIDYILTINSIKGNSQMNYMNYKRQIVEKLGVVLQGWPVPGHGCNPSKVSQTELEKLLDALKEEKCKGVKLTLQELAARIADNKACQAQGEQIYWPHCHHAAATRSAKDVEDLE
ncbi:hypothetical protein EDC04DRAFT_2612524 [Pisolithus marmoratus]|nr:hypothetical protein EDC04DRAFT_2612524 [Pisolithus marmoratus]